MTHNFDVVVVGAGAAGLFCAAIAGQRGLKVLVIDHSEKVAEKIRISGGGRCNFTNREVMPANFLSENPHFCRSALAGYTPQDFTALLQKHNVPFHEKHKGQLFCDRSAEDVINVLLAECAVGHVERWQPCSVKKVMHSGINNASSPIDTGAGSYKIDTDRGLIETPQLVIATGGLSIPKIGATDFGYRLARQFGHHMIDTRPALVPLTFDAAAWQPFVALAGLSLEARVQTGHGKSRGEFLEDLLFTHRGMSGPAVLQISSFWQPGTPLRIDLAPAHDLTQKLTDAKAVSRRKLSNELIELLPRRLAEAWLSPQPSLADKPMAELRDRDLQQLASGLQDWELTPSGTEGYKKAEVTSGGVDTRELSSNSMQSQRTPGLYFIGEVVDVTGWLGGYNFQWAWASAAACAQAMASSAT